MANFDISFEKCCHQTGPNDESLEELRKRLIPESEYQEKYKNEGFLGELSPHKNLLFSAGLPSKGKPECQPQDYDASDGILPHFREETTSKSDYKAQPTISKLQSYKPPPESSSKAPMLLTSFMTEVEPYSHSIHCPMPQELARKTAPSVPLWIREGMKPAECKTLYDLTSSYQADYCGVQTQPRKICLEKKNMQDEKVIGDLMTGQEYTYRQNPLNDTLDDRRLWDYTHSLLFRTTTNSNYLPPSVFGQPPCHPTKYHPDEQQIKYKSNKCQNKHL